jgi:GH43 family beta-xylosidase
MSISTDGFYYFCQSKGDKGIAVWRSDKLSNKGVKKVIWRTPKTGWDTSEVWAPELHNLNGKWYIYYAADDGYADFGAGTYNTPQKLDV